MRDTHPMSDFLEGAGHRPYRELVQKYLRSGSTGELHQASLLEITNLPEAAQDGATYYIDATNARFGYDQGFWATASCQDAFEAIIKIAIAVLPLEDRITSVESSLRPENQELAFALFQIPTLSFAYSASTQRSQRKFMGIRKGLFG